jgi:class 3 adenylate cyclase
MKMTDLRDELCDEVGTILASDFEIITRNTNVVPHSGDGAITFPNLDAKVQACKVIDTCVLYVDIRRSTELSITHKAATVAKLYSAFVRAMTKCARHYGGHVRGIIGDRVMVIFDCDDCFGKAVRCAVLMNATAKYVINQFFARGQVQCGIGIDTGKMLVTKTGFIRRGVEQHSYRNLVWLGRPANVASKLTDVANKESEGLTLDVVHVAYQYPWSVDWVWQKEWPHQFVKNVSHNGPALTHSHATYRAHFTIPEYLETKASTPPILMTEAVWNGFKAAHASDEMATKGWFKPVDLKVPGYNRTIIGGDVIYSAFNS